MVEVRHVSDVAVLGHEVDVGVVIDDDEPSRHAVPCYLCNAGVIQSRQFVVCRYAPVLCVDAIDISRREHEDAVGSHRVHRLRIAVSRENLPFPRALR